MDNHIAARRRHSIGTPVNGRVPIACGLEDVESTAFIGEVVAAHIAVHREVAREGVDGVAAFGWNVKLTVNTHVELHHGANGELGWGESGAEEDIIATVIDNRWGCRADNDILEGRVDNVIARIPFYKIWCASSDAVRRGKIYGQSTSASIVGCIIRSEHLNFWITCPEDAAGKCVTRQAKRQGKHIPPAILVEGDTLKDHVGVDTVQIGQGGGVILVGIEHEVEYEVAHKGATDTCVCSRIIGEFGLVAVQIGL